jgi:AmmeMemoRadiSam system protein A
MSSNECGWPLAQHGALLLDFARRSIRYGLFQGRPIAVALQELPGALTEPLASFITLELNGKLRGCVGTLDAIRPLVSDVAHNAYAAAFHDPRFPPITAAELDEIAIHISILTPAEEVAFSSEDDLVARLRPFVDGLIIQEGHQRGTFLPSVWRSLPDPKLFLQCLKQKAGMPRDYWSDTLKFYRYRTDVIS